MGEMVMTNREKPKRNSLLLRCQVPRHRAQEGVPRYQYVVASIDVGLEKLQVQVDGQTIEQYDYSVR